MSTSENFDEYVVFLLAPPSREKVLVTVKRSLGDLTGIDGRPRSLRT